VTSAFLGFSDWLYARIGQTHAIAHEPLVRLLRGYLLLASPVGGTCNEAAIDSALIEDYRAAGGRSRFEFEAVDSLAPAPRVAGAKRRGATPSRQARHLETQPAD
jgi:hypothetical protein